MKSERADYATIQAQWGNLSGNELTRKSSGNTRPQSSKLTEPLWTNPGIKSGNSARKLISTEKKKNTSREWLVKRSPQNHHKQRKSHHKCGRARNKRLTRTLQVKSPGGTIIQQNQYSTVWKLTCVCGVSRHTLPDAITSLMDSMLVPYKWPRYSPYSTNLPPQRKHLL